MSIIVLGMALGLASTVGSCTSDGATGPGTRSPPFTLRLEACPKSYELISVDETGDRAAAADVNGDRYICRRVRRPGEVGFTESLFKEVE